MAFAAAFPLSWNRKQNRNEYEIEFRQAGVPGDDADSIKKALLQPASSGKEELHEKDTDPQKKAEVLFSNEGIGNHRIKAGESWNSLSHRRKTGGEIGKKPLFYH